MGRKKTQTTLRIIYREMIATFQEKMWELDARSLARMRTDIQYYSDKIDEIWISTWRAGCERFFNEGTINAFIRIIKEVYPSYGTGYYNVMKWRDGLPEFIKKNVY